MNPAQQIIAGMIEGNLQQAWQLLYTKDWELAKHHLSDAITQIDQMRDAATPQTNDDSQQQTTLPI